jgi:long-chain acyl-CoA synthetase
MIQQPLVAHCAAISRAALPVDSRRLKLVLGLVDQAKRRPLDIAVRDPHLELTWPEFNLLLNRLVHGLRAATSRSAHPTVAVFGENSLMTLATHTAAVFAGVAPVAVNPGLTADEADFIVRDSGAQAIITGPRNLATALDLAERAGIAPVIAWEHTPGEEASGRPVDRLESVTYWGDWVASASEEEPTTNVAARPTMFYTSGTTGRPKGVHMRSPLAEATIEGYVEYLVAKATAVGMTAGPHLVVGPLCHTLPLGAVWALLAGSPVVVSKSFDAERAVRDIERYRIATSNMVPTHLVRFTKLPSEIRDSVDVSSLKSVILTGAACPPEVKQEVLNWWGPVIIEGYGGTETGILTMILATEWLEHVGSVGRCLPDVECLAVDDNGIELPPGSVGQLYFRDKTGQGVSYRNDPEKTAAAHLAPGVFTIGDVGYVDSDGYVYIVDRVIDMIVTGGTNIYCAEVEAVLVQHPKVRDAALVALPDQELGEIAHALVELADASDRPDPAEIIAYCRQRLAHYKCPRSVEFVRSLGRTDMGKLNKVRLRQANVEATS